MSEPLANGALFGIAQLKGYWKIDETSGTSVADSSGNSRTGTASRADILNQEAQSPQFGKCGLFVSANADVISIASHADFNFNSSFSIVARFKKTADTHQCIVSKGRTGGYQWGVYAGSSAVTCTLWTQSGAVFMGVSKAGDYTDGNWHTVVATYDGTTLRVYVDLDTVATSTSKSGTWYTSGAANVCIGNRDDGVGAFDGYIDDVALYNGKVISATEVEQIYYGDWWTATTNYLTNYRGRKRTPGAVSV